ncbi:MAG: GAF domain-containing protein [Chloroflexi bacterium]|nr:GAF domain-containing protein [Chloroflexota bacterium]
MIDQALVDLRRTVQGLQRLAMITSATLDINEMLVNALRETLGLLDCAGTQLWLPDYAAYRLVIHLPSRGGVAQRWPVESWPLDGLNHVVDAYHTGTSYQEPCTTFSGVTEQYNLVACPLNTRSRTLGVLEVAKVCEAEFSADQLELLQAVANQLAVSLSSAQTLAAERRRADLLGQINGISHELSATLDPGALLDAAAHRIHTVFGCHAVYLLLLTADQPLLQAAASAAHSPSLLLESERLIPLGQGVIGQAIRSGESQIAADLREDADYPALYQPRRLQSALITPLRRADDSIGLICLLSTDLNVFTEIERDALEMLAIQVSTTLENAEFYKQAQRRLMEQSVVHQIGQTLAAILDYRELSETLVQRMNHAISTAGCVVAYYEQEHDAVRVAADYRTPDHPHLDMPLLTGNYLPLAEHHTISQAIKTHQPATVYLNDPGTPPAARELLERIGMVSQLIVPMIAGDRVLGVVDWVDDMPGRRFSPDDMQLARTLVAQATVAVDNALLFQQLKAHADQLAEANRLRTQFLATISHELRTPMNSIIGFTETLMDGLYGQLSEQQSNRMERIQSNAYHLLALIDDLLDLSRIDAGRMKLHMEILGMRNVILTALQTIEASISAKSLNLTLNMPDDLPRIQADPERLHQVVINLLSNAVKFTHEGGITVTVREVNQNGLRFVETSVADTGIGISPTDQLIIFDEFRQADGSSTRVYGGTGMGLAITKKLVELMGGIILVESELGRGSTFSFTLPAAH